VSQTALMTAAESLADPFESLNGQALQKALFARLQPDTRKAVVACHSLHREMKGLEDPLTVLTWVTIWVRDWGLREDDAATILRAMTDPEKLREHKFASDLKCSLADAAAVCIKRRAAEAKQAALRGPEIAPDEQAKAAGMIRELVEGWQ